ncbi:MAG: survival protein SurA [Bdellovibrio sp. CG10_big_fil_rev_8_21_14_0_10_47_8]|nr:MAG: survival protein SurA [Bdellovibrio sp. CG10_big_fil_rev_8_21_14_0_10_47_8]
MKFFLVLSLSISSLFLSSHSYAEIVDRILAVVNTEIVTESDLKNFAKKVSQGSMIDDLLLFGQKQDTLKNNRTAQLNYLIDERILDSEIKRLNLSVTIERVEQEIRDIAKRNGVSRADLMGALKSQGMTASEYQDFIKTRIERQSLIEQEISSKIRVSDEDVMAQYIRSNPKNEAGIYEYTLAHILFNPRKGGALAAKERAESVLKKLRAGESFETLAEQNSEDPQFTNGGVLGTFKAGEFKQEMESAIRNLDAGEISNVVQTGAGFHIIKVLNKRIVTDPRFEKEKEKIRAVLFENAFQKHFKNWLETKREESFVRINQ